MNATILVVDDEPSVRETLIMALEDEYDVVAVRSGEEALDHISKSKVDLVLLDILMPEMDGFETLKAIRERDDELQVIMVTAVKEIQKAVESIKLGAFDYICKPYKLEELKRSISRALKVEELEKENIYLRSELDSRFQSTSIIGKSKAIRDTLAMIERIAGMDSTVLISGETGTGKELIARYVWQRSARSSRPFVVINCATIPSSLMESELFGHEKGAFTSADKRKTGKLEMADTGTVFLDEVSALSLDMQTKFLRVLQEKTIERVGGGRVIPIDARFIAATNTDLKKAIEEKTFREDLFYRLHVVPICIPPLRERREDIPLLIAHFLERFNRDFRKNIKGVCDEVMEICTSYRWPGNIRELENLMERLVVLTTEEIIPMNMIPQNMLTNEIDAAIETIPEELSLKQARQTFEKRYIEKLLKLTNGNVQQAAKLLGVHRATVLNKIQEYGLNRHKSVSHI
ncbi:MAG: sigma-54-dependent Fis family transcriptional regulator [Gemmatimonadota bacterium]|nr:MAG: sigma-54-dependent Fis family transcriptional regulator [Gemmatimonadota bacterium]